MEDAGVGVECARWFTTRRDGITQLTLSHLVGKLEPPSLIQPSHQQDLRAEQKKRKRRLRSRESQAENLGLGPVRSRRCSAPRKGGTGRIGGEKTLQDNLD